jgi:poly(3-hydroxybutyrate) depolymerase
MHDSNHQSSHRNRRFAALIGISASFVLILGVIAFNARAGTIPLLRQSSATSAKSAINLIPIHNECHTPPHKIGDETLSIQSGGLNRTFIVHLAPSYGNLPQALVITFHGYQNTALRTAQRTNMGIEADRAGFILAHSAIKSLHSLQ